MALLQIEPAEGEHGSHIAQRIAFSPLVAPDKLEPAADSFASLDSLRQLMLGFDVDPAQTVSLLSHWSGTCAAHMHGDEFTRGEDEILHIFVDICSLFHREPNVDGSIGAEQPSAELQLFTFLRTLDTSGEGLPVGFRDALLRALTHYGIPTLERSPELEQSLLWIYKSHQRVEQQTAAVFRILEQRLARVDIGSSAVPEFRTLLDRMISITRGAFHSISDLAKELR